MLLLLMVGLVLFVGVVGGAYCCMPFLHCCWCRCFVIVVVFCCFASCWCW